MTWGTQTKKTHKRVDCILFASVIFLAVYLVFYFVHNVSVSVDVVPVDDYERRYTLDCGEPDSAILASIMAGAYDSRYSTQGESSLIRAFVNNDDRIGAAILTIDVFDNYGKQIDEYTYELEIESRLSWIQVTTDGGYLLRIQRITDAKPGEARLCTLTIMKCAVDGKTEWTYVMDGITEGEAMYCVETDSGFILAGEGHFSGFRFIKLSKTGEYLAEKELVGTRHVSDIMGSFANENGKLLFTFALSSVDGDFAAEADENGYIEYEGWGIVSDDLKDVVLVREDNSWRSIIIIGYHTGRRIRSDDAMFENFEHGWPYLIADFSDGYLVVSKQRISGYYEYGEFTRAIVTGEERVFSFYNYDDRLIWQVTEK